MTSLICTRSGKQTEFLPGNFTHLQCYIIALHIHFHFSLSVGRRSWKCFNEITLKSERCCPRFQAVHVCLFKSLEKESFTSNSAVGSCAAASVFPALWNETVQYFSGSTTSTSSSWKPSISHPSQLTPLYNRSNHSLAQIWQAEKKHGNSEGDGYWGGDRFWKSTFVA